VPVAGNLVGEDDFGAQLLQVFENLEVFMPKTNRWRTQPLALARLEQIPPDTGQRV